MQCAVFSPSRIQGMIWMGPTTALKLLMSDVNSFPYQRCIMQLCWPDMHYTCIIWWEKHWPEREFKKDILRDREREKEMDTCIGIETMQREIAREGGEREHGHDTHEWLGEAITSLFVP